MSNGTTQAVTLTPNHVPPPACYPADYNALVDALTTGGGITGTIPTNSGGGIYVGNVPPDSSLTNKVWYKTDPAGRPLGVFMFYNGNWRPVYTGVAIGEIRMYWGPNSVFDGTGRAIIGSSIDGWALCNGQNGTPNLDNLFPVFSSQYNGGWVSNPSGLSGRAYSGGAPYSQITCINLPDLWAQTGSADVAAGSGAGVLQLFGTGSTIDIPIRDLVNNCQPAGQQPMDNTPPWNSLAAIMFVGYQ